MPVAYAITNFLNDDTYCCESSINTDSDWVDPVNLYNALPSYPFRFDGVGAVGNPEWICWDLGSARQITLAAIFNHNIRLLSAVGDEWRLKLCSMPCEGSGACNWNAPDIAELDLSPRRLDNFNNIYRIMNYTARYGRIDIIDQNNAAGYAEFGEVFIGQKTNFSSHVHLQIGWKDSPEYFEGKQQTYYGQDHGAYYANAKNLSLVFADINNPQVVSEFQVFLDSIKRNNGIFVIVPDTDTKFVYYVICTNMSNFGERPIYSSDCDEERFWTLELKSLVEGIPLL